MSTWIKAEYYFDVRRAVLRIPLKGMVSWFQEVSRIGSSEVEVIEDMVRQLIINCAPQYEQAVIVAIRYDVYTQMTDIEVIHPLLEPVKPYMQSPVIVLGHEEQQIHDSVIIRNGSRPLGVDQGAPEGSLLAVLGDYDDVYYGNDSGLHTTDSRLPTSGSDDLF